MKNILIGCLCISILLTILLGCLAWRRGSCMRREGFANARDANNPLFSLVGKVKKMGTMLLDTDMWVERIEMSTMNPTQLARRYIHQQMKSKNKKPE